MKRVIAFILALLIVTGMFPATALHTHAEGTEETHIQVEETQPTQPAAPEETVAPVAAEPKAAATHTHTYQNGICIGCRTADPNVTAEILPLRYDDHLDMTGKTVEILDAGTAVVALENNMLVATGIGNAKVKIDGTEYNVAVEKAKINLIVIMGQSNAGNHFVNATSDITCPLGTAYWWGNGQGTNATEPVPYTQASMGFHTPLLAELYAQSVVAGDPVKNVMIWHEGITSKNGQSIVKWAASATNTSGTDAAVTMIENCRAYYEARSDKYEIVGNSVYWLQGESDTAMDPELYTLRFMAMWERLKAAGMDSLAFFRVRRGMDENDAGHNDLYHSASLSAQIKMVNDNPEFYMATDLTENWVGTETVTHTVDISNYSTVMETYGKYAAYTDQYGNNATCADGKLTTTMKSLYGSNNKCHYGKFGYGLIAADAAYNMYRALHEDHVAIVVTDTSGHASQKQVLSDGQTVTIDITNTTEDLSFRAECGSVAGTLSITVKSGGKDVTDRNDLIITNGQHYGAVNTAQLLELEDVFIEVAYKTINGETHTVICKIDHAPLPPKRDYIWNFDEDLNAKGTDGQIQNAFIETALSGSYTLENGYLTCKNLQLQLENPIELEADKNWCVEWKYGAFTNGVAGFLLCEEPRNTIGNKGLYHVPQGHLMISDYADSVGYRNYTSQSAKISENDCLKLMNRYDPDTGKSTISLWINGELAVEDFQQKGSLNKYHDDLDMTGYPLIADFSFCYLGNNGMSNWQVNCQLDYLKISFGEEAEPAQTLSLRYDDHLDMTGKTVEILDAGQPTSYQVGYGVAENAVADTAVVTLKDNTLVATGIGSAKVKIDGQLYEVTVTAAPISLLLLIGQSNMRGSEGNADQSIVCPDGMVYATFGDDRGDAEGIMNVNNATKFAASALTGPYSTINVEGTTEHLSYYPIHALTEAGKGTFGPDSGFAYEWVKQTGEKVWVVNAAHGGSSIKTWAEGATNFKECDLLFSACQETLRKEIAAGHFTLSHMGYFWCQGCSDYNWSAEEYVTKYLAMHDGLKKELSFDHDSNVDTADKVLEFAGIIPVRTGHDYNDGYREGVYSDSTTQRFYESFADLQMTGPRVAQYWMTNNPELPDIWNVCNIGENWVWMPDGTNGVSDYFQAHYPEGTVDYTTQVKQSASWYTPTTPKAVHDSIHYNQIGYNEVGRESVRNALIMLGETKAPNVETTVELLTWDGYTLATQVSASLNGNSETLVVPKVYPVWKSKEVNYTLSEGLIWSYYDLLTTQDNISGTLTSNASKQVVTVAGHNWSEWKTIKEPSAEGVGQKQRICADCGKTETQEIKGVWQIYDLSAHLQELPENVCCATNLWSILSHETVHFTSGKKWGNTSTPVTSITIPVNPGDKIYATSWNKAGENGHATADGIRLTFFDAQGIAQTLGPGESYRKFAANGGYLVAPEGSIAINIAMWYDSEDYEVYILNRDHTYQNGICLGCGSKDPHYYLPGDINGDGLVNNKDLTRLFQYLSAYDVEVNEKTLNVNGDGAVNNKDLTRLFQYLSGYKVEIF